MSDHLLSSTGSGDFYSVSRHRLPSAISAGRATMFGLPRAGVQSPKEAPSHACIEGIGITPVTRISLN